MNKVLLAGLCFTTLTWSHAFAGVDETKTCSDKLPEQAQIIVQAMIPKMKPGIDARSVMKSTVRGLVWSGKIDRSDARSNAVAAGECLKKLRD